MVGGREVSKTDDGHSKKDGCGGEWREEKRTLGPGSLVCSMQPHPPRLAPARRPSEVAPRPQARAFCRPAFKLRLMFMAFF